MSENSNLDPTDGINININNSDTSSSGSGSFIDKIFDLGLKLLIPLLLVFGLFTVVIFFGVVLPILTDVSDIILPTLDVALPFSAPVSAILGGAGAVLGWITGR